jgi:uncharacterized protein YjdB
MMKHLKKTIAVALTLVMVFGLLPLPEVTPPASAAKNLTGISSHWAYDHIRRINALGALDDFPSGNFQPNKYITRAEFLSIVVRILGGYVAGDISQFTDVPSDAWYYNNLAIAYNMGIASGYGNRLYPNNNISRQDAATVIANALGMVSENEYVLSRFSDSGQVANYARTSLAAMVEAEQITGYKGFVQPTRYMTRAEAVTLISNLFPNVSKLETPYNNVSLKGGLLVFSPESELRNVVLYGDVTIGDGVGTGSVVLSNCTIFGRLIIRGGGVNSITLSNTYVDGIYIASYGQHTRIALTDDSVAPKLEAVSGFTLSGRGVTAVQFLDHARENATINLDGVNIDDLHVGSRGAMVTLTSGRVLNARFDGSGHSTSLDIKPAASVENLIIADPNVSVTGTGEIRSLLVKNTGATVAQNPEFTTVAVNFTANVGGKLVVGPAASTANIYDRVSTTTRHVRLIGDATTLTVNALDIQTVEGRSATEIHMSQLVTGRIALTQQGNRLGYWVGLFIPAPPSASNAVSVTYTYIDGEPVSFTQTLTSDSGQRGLTIYLPVFKKAGTDTGQFVETLYINWGGGITENLQFTSVPLNLIPLTEIQRQTLEQQFVGTVPDGNGPLFYSITGRAIRGAEAVRRIMTSDNPLGLPTTGNPGLDAINRAMTPDEIQSIIEEPRFAGDLTIQTDNASQYSRLSNAGKATVAKALLTARKTSFASAAAVKTAFDNAVVARLNAESNLLTQINAAGDATIMQKLIETAANAALLELQTGADPYKSFPPSQRLELAQILMDNKLYASLQTVIDLIKAYLDAHSTPSSLRPGDVTITAFRVNPTSIPASDRFAFGSASRVITLTVTASNGQTLSYADLIDLDFYPTFEWRNGPAITFVPQFKAGKNGEPTIVLDAENLNATTNTTRTLVITVGGRTANVNVTVIPSLPAQNIAIQPPTRTMFVGDTAGLQAVLTRDDRQTPTDSVIWMSRDESIATVEPSENGMSCVVTAHSRGIVEVIAILKSNESRFATCQVRVFQDANDILVDPSYLVLVAQGSPGEATVYTATPGRVWTVASRGSFINSASGSGNTLRITTKAIDSDKVIDTVTLQTNNSNPSEENNYSGRAVVTTEIRQSTGIYALLDDSVIPSNGSTKLRLENVDSAMATQKFYIRVDKDYTPESAGDLLDSIQGKAADVLGGPAFNANDTIEIKAAPAGIGRVVIQVYTVPSGGTPICPPVYLTVAPQSVEVTFRQSGTTGTWYPSIDRNGSGERMAAGDLPQNRRVLTMQLADSQTIVTPRARNSSETMPDMVWKPPYVTNANMQILYSFRTYTASTSYTPPGGTAVTLAEGTLRDKAGRPIEDPRSPVSDASAANGGYLTFYDDTVFVRDGGWRGWDPASPSSGYYEFHTPSVATDVYKKAFFKQGEGLDQVRYAVLRGGGYDRESTDLLNIASNGRLYPNTFMYTGLAAVMLTPNRDSMSSDAGRIWGDLFYTQAMLFVDGMFNPAISEESGFKLLEYNGTEFVPTTDTSIYEIRQEWILSNVSNYDPLANPNVKYRITDINGEPLETGVRVGAIRLMDVNEENNTFYVWLLPNPITSPPNVYQEVPYIPPAVPPDPPIPEYMRTTIGNSQITPGSKDTYDIMQPDDTRSEAEFKTHYPRFDTSRLSPRGSPFADEADLLAKSRMYLAFLTSEFYYIYLPTVHPDQFPAVQPATYYDYYTTLSVTQVSKQGFAVQPTSPSDTRRDGPVESAIYDPSSPATNRQPVSYTLRFLRPPTDLGTFNINLLRVGSVTTLFVPDTVNATPINSNNLKMIFDTLRVNLSDITITKATGIGLDGDVTISSGAYSVATTITGTTVGSVQLLLTCAEGTMTLNITVQPAGYVSAMAPIMGISSPVAAIPEVQTVAVKTLGISLESFATEAIVEVAEGYEMMAVITETTDAATGEKTQTITPKREGRLKLKVKTRDGKKSASVTVDVLPADGLQPGEPGKPPTTPTTPTTPTPIPLTELQLRKTASVALGKTMTLIPYVSPIDADKSRLIWVTSDATIATVTDGVVKGLKAGKVTITALDPDDGLQAQTTVTVKEDKTPVKSIKFSRTDLTLDVGKSRSALSVTISPTAVTIRGASWKSSNENIVRVEPTGRITAIAPGTAVITAISDSGGRTASCTVYVVIPVESVTLSETKITLKVGASYTLQPIITPSNATDKSVTYSVGSSTIATVSSKGVITAKKAGTTTITVKAGGKSAKVTIVVQP